VVKINDDVKETNENVNEQNIEIESFIKFNKELVKTEANNNKLILVMAYLKLNSPLNGRVGISLDLLCKEIGYTPNQREGMINQQIINSLQWLEMRGAIYIFAKFKPIKKKDEKQDGAINIHNENESDKVEYVKKNDCFIVQLENKSEIFNQDNNFVTLYESEFNTIIKAKTKYNRQDLLNVYLNIKKFINLNSKTIQLCYPSHRTLAKDCGISSIGKVNNIISELIRIKLLYTYNSGKYLDKNEKVKYANSFYAVEKGVLKPDVCDDIIRNYYSTQGIIITEFIKDNNTH
jgi:hypothetical protein